MKLGAFSISLNVKDISASQEFYQKLGFTVFHDQVAQGWCMLKNGDTIIGLFSGIIPTNTLTFNPGWDQNAQPSDPFDDVRDIQKHLQDAGLSLTETCDQVGSGPAHIALLDPDGNAILIDQHR